MRKYYTGEILFCGVLRRYVSQNIVAVTGNLRLNRCTLFNVFNWWIFAVEVVLHFINTWDIKHKNKQIFYFLYLFSECNLIVNSWNEITWKAKKHLCWARLSSVHIYACVFCYFKSIVNFNYCFIGRTLTNIWSLTLYLEAGETELINYETRLLYSSR